MDAILEIKVNQSLHVCTDFTIYSENVADSIIISS